MFDYSIIGLIPLIPLATFVLLGLFGQKYFRKSAGIIGCISLLVSTIISILIAYNYFFVDGKLNETYRTITALKFTWLQISPSLSVDMGLMIDPISVMMILVVSFISLMVHIFSLGYMKGEKRFATYFAFLSLFTFSMLGLVLSSNLIQIYIFWELVGVSSFLLIGFYFDRPSAVAAAKKAFIVTRFADFGFLIGILVLGFYGGTLDFATLLQTLSNPASTEFQRISGTGFIGVSVLTWALTLVFIGGAGKSAMFPFHIWLPDAMEGPTPVSALIHAATMVVAGVYLVARMFPLYAVDAISLQIVTIVGALSALLAAVIACTQTDIKRVLAYSTMSQIGYMMFSLGISGDTDETNLGYTASMFHLFTHAFFKSLLFLGAGAVIHYIHSNEMRDMGGLRKQMPITHLSFLIACLAIAGIPPLSGFFSKEEILLAAFEKNLIVYGVALFTAGLTAFYMFRLYFSVFWNKPNEIQHTHSEATPFMKISLVTLAICTIIAGWIPFGKFISADGNGRETELHLLFSIAPIAISVVGILFAASLYKRENEKPSRIADSFGKLYQTAYRKFYIDEIYLFITRKIIFNLLARPAAWIDKNIVDGSVNLIASATGRTSELIKGLQSGKIQSYALYFFGGIVALAALFIYWLK